MAPTIYDRSGAERDWAWLRAKYGDIRYSISTFKTAYRLVEIREQEGHSALIATLRDADGKLLPGIQVIRYWPDAPNLPTWDAPPERWFPKGVHGKTNADGNIGFGMGGDDHYYPDQNQTGASAIWVGHTGYGSDCMRGLGWIVAETDLHLNLTFQQVIDGEEPPEPPEPPSGDALDRIAAALESIAAQGIKVQLSLG